MEQEQIDPVYKYVDDKIKLIKRELSQLKVAHDATIQRHQEALLVSSRNIARFIILSTARQTKDIIYREKPSIDNQIIIQLLLDAKGARIEVDTSDNPLLTSAKFENNCLELLKRLGIKVVIT